MPRLVTGLFYDRSEAERAVDALRAQGIPSEDIYLEEEVTPTADIGRKGGEVSSLETERRFAGLETGLVIGLTVGILAGLGVGMMGTAISEMMIRVDPQSHFAPVLANPALTALGGALLGLIAGGLIGWIVDHTLTRMGAGPPLPQQETLVTVRTDEGNLDQVYAMLHRARARHLHVAERSAA
jgi:hypothetical protein